LGSIIIVKQAPDFDHRNYGYKKLGELVEATELFDIDERPISNGRTKAIYVRDRKGPKSPCFLGGQNMKKMKILYRHKETT